ncbi:MAG: DUF3348 family protein [Myxococcota bacterium]|nr:DUF3348 family protein [Myxococcota bacterium]
MLRMRYSNSVMTSDNGKVSHPPRPLGVLHQAVTKVTEQPYHVGDSPESLFASLLNIKGSVQLESYLANQVPVQPTDSPPIPVETIRARLALGLEDVRRRIDADFATAYRPRFRLPTAQRVWSTLHRTGYWKARASGEKKSIQKVFRATVRTTWAPFAEFIEVRVKRALFALGELRDRLGEDIRTLGDEAVRLESLDAVMKAAIKPEVHALYQRVYATNERRFEAVFKQAMEDLPDVAAQEGFELGFCESGWLGETFKEAMALASAICEYEITQLTRFVEAAIAATADHGEPPR